MSVRLATPRCGRGGGVRGQLGACTYVYKEVSVSAAVVRWRGWGWVAECSSLPGCTMTIGGCGRGAMRVRSGAGRRFNPCCDRVFFFLLRLLRVDDVLRKLSLAPSMPVDGRVCMGWWEGGGGAHMVQGRSRTASPGVRGRERTSSPPVSRTHSHSLPPAPPSPPRCWSEKESSPSYQPRPRPVLRSVWPPSIGWRYVATGRPCGAYPASAPRAASAANGAAGIERGPGLLYTVHCSGFGGKGVLEAAYVHISCTHLDILATEFRKGEGLFTHDCKQDSCIVRTYLRRVPA